MMYRHEKEDLYDLIYKVVEGGGDYDAGWPVGTADQLMDIADGIENYRIVITMTLVAARAVAWGRRADKAQREADDCRKNADLLRALITIGDVKEDGP